MQGSTDYERSIPQNSYIPVTGDGDRGGGGTYGGTSLVPTLSDYERVFGPAARNIREDPQRNKRHQRWHLPDALKGSNPWMADRIDGLISDSNTSPFTTVILPYKYIENVDAKIKWNVWSFDEGLASRVPYEAPARVLTQTKRSFRGYTVRQGLAITMEHNFMMSPAGVKNFENQLQQMVGSIQQTNDLDVHVALVTAPSYARTIQEKYFSSGKTPAQQWREYIDIFGFMQKNPNAMDILIEEAKKTLATWGARDPTFMLLNSKVTFQMTMVPAKTEYFTQGYDGIKRLQQGPDIPSYRGLNIVHSRAYSLETNAQPRDILRRRVRTAEFYRIPYSATASSRHYQFYDESRDTWFTLSYNDLLRMADVIGDVPGQLHAQMGGTCLTALGEDNMVYCVSTDPVDAAHPAAAVDYTPFFGGAAVIHTYLPACTLNTNVVNPYGQRIQAVAEFRRETAPAVDAPPGGLPVPLDDAADPLLFHSNTPLMFRLFLRMPITRRLVSVLLRPISCNIVTSIGVKAAQHVFPLPSFAYGNVLRVLITYFTTPYPGERAAIASELPFVLEFEGAVREAMVAHGTRFNTVNVEVLVNDIIGRLNRHVVDIESEYSHPVNLDDFGMVGVSWLVGRSYSIGTAKICDERIEDAVLSFLWAAFRVLHMTLNNRLYVNRGALDTLRASVELGELGDNTLRNTWHGGAPTMENLRARVDALYTRNGGSLRAKIEHFLLAGSVGAGPGGDVGAPADRTYPRDFLFPDTSIRRLFRAPVAAGAEDPRGYEVVVVRPNIEHNMLGVVMGRGGIDDLGATLWGQTELSCYDDGMHGVWSMSYKYNERAMVFNEKNLVRLWDIAYDGYNGGKDDTAVDFLDQSSVRAYREAVNNRQDPYTGPSMIVMKFPVDQRSTKWKRNWASPIAWDTDTCSQYAIDPESGSVFSTTEANCVFAEDMYKERFKRYRQCFHDATLQHRTNKPPGHAAHENESSTVALAFQGSMRVLDERGTLIEEVHGSGHHGRDYVGAAAARAGRSTHYSTFASTIRASA